MLRSIGNQFRKPVQLTALSSRFCTKSKFDTQINDVKLIGTVQSGVTKLGDSKAFVVRTIDSRSSYTNHRVILKANVHFSAGQRVFVWGKLKSNNFQLNDGKNVQRTTVKATKLFVLEDESAGSVSTHGDQNCVNMLGNIAGNILNKDNSSMFLLTTNFVIKNPGRNEEEGVNFHQVIAYNHELRECIQNNLKRGDRVMITGKLGQMARTQPNGKKIHAGFVEVKSVLNINRRSFDSEAKEQEMLHTKQ